MGKSIDDEKARELYDAGENDRIIGDTFGVTKSAVALWRRKNNLPANAGSFGRKRKEAEPVAAERKISSAKELPAAVRERVEALMPQEAPVESKPSIPDDLDPLVNEAFGIAVNRLFQLGMPVQMGWRKLLSLTEIHVRKLYPYMKISEEAVRCAIELAAIASIDGINEAREAP